MLPLWDAIYEGDLGSVKRLVVEGLDVKERNSYGVTPFLRAAEQGNIPIMHWLLTEGGSNLDEKGARGARALLIAAIGGCYAAAQYLLEKHGAIITESDDHGSNVWIALSEMCYLRNAELSSLIKVMVMLEDAPRFYIATLAPYDAELCTRGRELRAQLPSYLEQ
jgi:ankyrin repeat protein